MNPTPDSQAPDGGSDDDALASALDAYLADLEAGRPADAERLLADNPDLAPRLRACLAGMRALDGPPPELPDGRPGQLGDFRLIREVGRGGMGVVYEAEQISLGRRVALKVLPFAATLDPRRLQRFKAEAQAAAGLHHTHIVPVYAVGCERGVHFYAMQFIDGQNLEAALRGLFPSGSPPAAPAGPTTAEAAVGSTRSADRRDYFRRLAEVGVQAAEALEHAHEQGVVHRDIKPANLLLDGRGHLWVADFGLAQMQSGEALTRTGDVVGTLRYMSPEQALGRRGLVDHRADVYSLGATLYELLTRRPLFPGRDQQELLRQIAQDEPALPRRVNRAVPRELELIVLKAVAKEPADRYPTAQELADDLRRFLEDRPVRAKRPSARDRLAKWARRHQRAVLAALGVLAVAVVSLAAGVVLLDQARRETTLAYVGEKTARDALQTKEKEARAAWAQERQMRARHGLDLAHREWWDNRVASAELLLDDCPADLRHWEWHYLKRLCHAGLLTLRPPDRGAWCSAVSPDGRLLATSGPDWTVCLWELPSGRPLGDLPGLPERTYALAFSPDGTRLAAANGLSLTDFGPYFLKEKSEFPCTVKVWDADQRRELFTCRGHTTAVYGLRFSPDGRRLVTAGHDRTVRIWDAADGTGLHVLRHAAPVLAVGFRADGMALSAGQDRTIRTWGPATGKAVSTVPGPALIGPSVTFSPDGRRLAFAAPLDNLQLWDVATSQTVRAWRGHAGAILSVAFSHTGDWLVTGGADQTVRVWHQSSTKEFRLYRGHTGAVPHVTVAPGDRRLVSVGADRTVKVWDATAPQEARPLGPPVAGPGGRASAVAFGPGGEELAVGYQDGAVRVWDLSRAEVRLTIDGPASAPLGLACSDDGRLMAAAGFDGAVRVWEAATGRARSSFSLGERPAQVVGLWGLTFDPEGRRLTVADTETVTRRDLEAGRSTAGPAGGMGQPHQVVFSPDGSRFARLVPGRPVTVGDTAALREDQCLPDETGFSLAAAFSRDGRRLALAGRSAAPEEAGNLCVVTVWDLESARPVVELRGRASVNPALALSPDGQRVVTGDDDGTLKIWDGSSGHELLSLRGAGRKVRALTFSPDGRRLAALDFTGQVQIWDARPE